jgi:hypothetical protein
MKGMRWKWMGWSWACWSPWTKIYSTYYFFFFSFLLCLYSFVMVFNLVSIDVIFFVKECECQSCGK